MQPRTAPQLRWDWQATLFWLAALASLYATSRYSFLLFHSIAEVFSIVIAAGTFMIAWNARNFMRNSALLFLGIGYLFVGGIDLLHTLAYKGMGIFTPESGNLATQLWIAGRYLQSLVLLATPFWVGRSLNARWVFGFFTLTAGLLLAAIFSWQVFPVCFAENTGVTPFKTASEYVVAGLLLAAVAALWSRSEDFDALVFRRLVFSILLTIAAELTFTVYTNLYGLRNLIGHFLKCISFYLVYKAIIETGLVRPYDLLFRDLNRSEQSLRESERQLATLMANLPGMAYRCRRDQRWTMVFVSEGCRLLTGYAPEDLIQNRRKAYADLIHPEDRQQVWTAVQGAVADKKPFQVAYRLLTAGGTEKWVWEQGVGVWSSAGEADALEGFIIDISDRKKSEEERREREKLQAVLEAAGAVCHELNQPLESMCG